jgi:hypothetical protein
MSQSSAEQVTADLHVEEPVQATLHLGPEHWMGPHAPPLVQAMSHDVAPLQSTPPLHPPELQIT